MDEEPDALSAPILFAFHDPKSMHWTTACFDAREQVMFINDSSSHGAVKGFSDQPVQLLLDLLTLHQASQCSDLSSAEQSICF